MILRIPPPNEKQKLFLQADTKHVGFGGARGGGKSWAVRTKAKLLCLAYPGIKILIVRRTYPELINNHINPLIDELHGVAKYNKNEKVFNFPNGSTIKFGYCNADKDLGQYQGSEYDTLFLDEVTQMQPLWIQKITACMRGANDFPKRCYWTMNPGGPSHGFVKRLFIDKRYEPGENPEDYTFIQSLVTDNKALLDKQPDYIKQLEALPPKLREAWLHGRWDIFEGQFFEEFRDDPEHYADRKWTHVISPFSIPREWTVIRSFDWGYNKPFSLSWYAIDFDGVIYRILELYGCTEEPNTGVKWTDDKIFSEARRIENEHPYLAGRQITGVADPAIWDVSRGISTAETATKYGIYFTKGDHKRIPGWMQCHYRLAFNAEGYPQFYVFSNCKQFIRTIPTLCYDEHKVEDIDTEGEDHIADEWRYALMSRPIKPVMTEDEQVLAFDPLNQQQPLKRSGIRIY